MEKIGVMGGTFNPVHKGHINAACLFAKELSLNYVLMIPDKLPPHKEYAGGASDDDRLNMLRLATEEYPFLTVSDMEIKRGGKSYTYDTLTELRKVHSDAEIFFLTGTDMFLTLDRWYKYPDILALATFTVMPRNDGDTEKLLAAQKKYKDLGYRTVVLSGNPFPASSSAIRENAGGKEAYDILPEKVLNYISEKKLYV